MRLLPDTDVARLPAMAAFKSVGIAPQDLTLAPALLAPALLARAEATDVGTVFDWEGAAC